MTDKIVISADRGFRRRGSFRHGCASARQAAERQGDQAFLRRLVRAIRAHWPRTEILLRADSHYCGPEVLDWCRAVGLDYILGVAPTTTLRRHVAGLEASTKARFEAGSGDGKLRRFKEFFDGAQSWSRVERIVARVQVGEEGADTRFVVTNLTHRNARRLYEDVYCRRGQAENHIKSWKTHLAADRTSCTKATANQLQVALRPFQCLDRGLLDDADHDRILGRRHARGADEKSGAVRAALIYRSATWAIPRPNRSPGPSP